MGQVLVALKSGVERPLTDAEVVLTRCSNAAVVFSCALEAGLKREGPQVND